MKIREVLRFNDLLQRSGSGQATVKPDRAATAEVRYGDPPTDVDAR